MDHDYLVFGAESLGILGHVELGRRHGAAQAGDQQARLEPQGSDLGGMTSGGDGIAVARPRAGTRPVPPPIGTGIYGHLGKIIVFAFSRGGFPPSPGERQRRCGTGAQAPGSVGATGAGLGMGARTRLQNQARRFYR